MEMLNILSSVKEVIVTLSALTGVIIAYKGLEKWKQELVGKSNYDTAKSLLRATYQTRKAIHQLRRNLILKEEYNYLEKLSEVEIFQSAFNKRLQILDDAVLNLDEYIVEGQALWGKDIEATFSILKLLIEKLRLSIDSYINLINEPTIDKESIEFLELKAIIFHVPMLDNAHGSFAHALYIAFKEIEDKIRIHLK